MDDQIVIIPPGMTPRESASLARRLMRGADRAWTASHDAYSNRQPDALSRFDMAAEVDGVFRDVLWDQVNLGWRQPGETPDQMMSRIARENRKAARNDATARIAARHRAEWDALPEAEQRRRYDAMVAQCSGMAWQSPNVLP